MAKGWCASGSRLTDGSVCALGEVTVSMIGACGIPAQKVTDPTQTETTTLSDSVPLVPVIVTL